MSQNDIARRARPHIRDLRRKRGLTQQALGELIGMEQEGVARIESGRRGLTLPVAEKMAVALESDLQTVLGIDPKHANGPGPGLDEDAAPYTPDAADSWQINTRKHPNRFPWRIKTRAVELQGYLPGDIVEVDNSAEAVENVPPLACVVVQAFAAGGAVTLVRQLVPPSLLITSQSTGTRRSSISRRTTCTSRA